MGIDITKFIQFGAQIRNTGQSLTAGISKMSQIPYICKAAEKQERPIFLIFETKPWNQCKPFRVIKWAAIGTNQVRGFLNGQKSERIKNKWERRYSNILNVRVSLEWVTSTKKNKTFR
jgi:hypothetical protein